MRISSPPNKIVKSAPEHKIPSFRIISYFTVYWMYIFSVRSFIHCYQAYTNCVRSLFSVLIFLLVVTCLHMEFLVDVYSVYFARVAKINPTSKCPIDNDPIFKIQKFIASIVFFRIRFIFHSGKPVCISV